MLKNDHVAFQVSDLDAALAFYTGTFGLKLMFSARDEAHHEAYAFLELDGGNLELLQLLDEANQPIPLKKTEPAPPYCPHLALATDDLAALEASLHEKGVAILKGPLLIEDKVTWLYLADLDGNVIEFVQWL